MKLRRKPQQEEEWPPEVPDGAVLGRRVGGERDALPMRGRAVIWPFGQLKRHAAIFGDPETGKTETAMRIAHELASKSDAPVVYLDVGGDRNAEARFRAVMGDVGRRVRVFPDEPFDAWRGEPQALSSRLHHLHGLVGDAERTGFEADLAAVMLQTALRHPDGPPRSSSELLSRLDYEALLALDGETFSRVQASAAEGARMGYRAFFGPLDGGLDGEWSWEDADAAYIRLDRDELGPGTPRLTRFFLDDWIAYLHQRKAPEQLALLFLRGLREEVLSGRDLQPLLGQAGARNGGIVMTWDSPADIGPEEQRSILYGAFWTTIVHATRRPAGIGDLAGTKRASEVETIARYDDHGEYRPEQLMRQRERPKLSDADLAKPPPGTAWIIESGRAVEVKIEPPLT